MGDLERRLLEQFKSHEQTAEGLLPAGADQQTVARHRSETQYVALKEALVEIGRSIDQLSDRRIADLERRLDSLGETLAAAKLDKHQSKKKRKHP